MTAVLSMLVVNFSFLLQLADSKSQKLCTAAGCGEQAVNMVIHSLRMMALGGMHDHVGQVGID